MDTKHCSRCGTTKLHSEFNKNKRSRDGLQTYCRECKRAYDRKNYAESSKRRAQIKRRRVKNNEKYTQQAQKYVANYLKTHPCVDCGETNIIALQFDHVRGDKKTTISEMCIKGYALQTIKDEIAKCDVRCGNCHSRKTAKENNSLAYRLLKEMQDE